MARKHKPFTSIIAVDPGAKSGIAQFVISESNAKFLDTHAVRLNQIPEPVRIFAGDRPLIVVERSKAGIPQFRAHRADAKKFADALKASLGGKVVFIDPNTWQRGLGVCNPDCAEDKLKGRMKYDQYAFECFDRLFQTMDEVAAFLIGHYALKMRYHHQAQVPANFKKGYLE